MFYLLNYIINNVLLDFIRIEKCNKTLDIRYLLTNYWKPNLRILVFFQNLFLES